MSVDEKEEMEGKTEVEESESKSSSPQGLIKLDEAAVQVNANIVGDQELKVLPGNKEEDKVVEVKDTGIKSLPRATTTTPIGKRKKQQPLQNQQRQKKETTIPNISKQVQQQSADIKKIKSMLQSQSQLVKQLKLQLKQVQKRISQIQKYAGKTKKIK